MYRLLLFLYAFLCVSFTINGQVVINEYTGANYDTHLDNYGEYEDWVELYNPTSSPIDLNGWFLSDKPSNPNKWMFTSSSVIPANGTLLIYCSGRNEITNTGVHTNFKITQTKGSEVLVLTDNNTTFQDSVRIIPNQKSHTRGRQSDGASVWSVFINGTPNSSNTGAMQEYATTPIFSQIGGYYSGPINLTLSSTNSSATIYYTTNGETPDNTSNVYVGPILINNTSVIKAIAYSSNSTTPPSFIGFNTFFINDTHTIPILSISGDEVWDLLDGGPGSTSMEPDGTVEWFAADGTLLDKGTGEFNKHGNDSWAYDQRGFDYIMRDQFGYNYAIKDKIFMNKDRDKFQRVMLKAAANDNFSFEDGAHIRDSYCHHLSQVGNLRMDERSSSACIVYRDGDYWGVYDIREKVDDHDFTDHYYDQNRNNLQFLKTWGGTWSEYGGAQAQNDWDNLVAFITSNPMSNQANYLQVKNEYNTGSLIDYFLLNSYVVSSDWLNWNTAWWRGLDPAGDKKKWRYALWDLDATFDHYINYSWPGNWQATTSNDPCEAADLLNDPGGQGHVPIWQSLLENQDFHNDYINRWQDLANGVFSCSTMVAILDSMVAVIAPEMPRQISTWGGGTYGDWQNNVSELRNFILARCDSMNNGFIDCDTAITGIFNVTVEIIGNGEIEMSNNNIIGPLTSPFGDERFGGVELPFKVLSGAFDRWEVISSNVYAYNPNADTLTLDLQGDVLVRAYFVPPVVTREITYIISPTNTTTTININGTVVNSFPFTETYTMNDTVNIFANIDPLYSFNSWSSDSVFFNSNLSNPSNSFYAMYNDTVILYIYETPNVNAFISGNDTICSNSEDYAEVTVSFNGVPPFKFSYSLSGIMQTTITTSINPYIIKTKRQGEYVLSSFSDANEIGSFSGQALVSVLQSPVADFSISSDSLSILYTTVHLTDKSSGNIINWQWDYGDNSSYGQTQNPYHTYQQSSDTYQINLIVTDYMGCADTMYKFISVFDEHYIYIPNSFTPDLDGKNDKLCIHYNGIRESSFIINIYNKVGEVVYSTNNITDLLCNKGWEGKHQSTGNDLPLGVYVYELYFQDIRGWKHKDISYVTIIR